MKEDFGEDGLWDLLGRARPVVVSPYFSRRVLRDIHQVPARPLLPAFLLRWVAGGVLAVLCAGFFMNLAQVQMLSLADNREFNLLFDRVSGIDSLVVVDDLQFSGVAQNF